MYLLATGVSGAMADGAAFALCAACWLSQSIPSFALGKETQGILLDLHSVLGGKDVTSSFSFYQCEPNFWFHSVVHIKREALPCG